MTGRAFVLSIAVTAVVFAIGGRCTAPDPAPLPPRIVKQIETKLVRDAVDSATIVRLQGENAQLLRRVDVALVSAHRSDSTARLARGAADTAAAAPAPDWQNAYRLRSIEAANLRVAGATKDTVITELRDTVTARADTIQLLRHAGQLRADSLANALIPLAERGDPCRVPGTFGLVHCPTRTQTFIGGVLAGAAGYALATGKIKIKIPIRF